MAASEPLATYLNDHLAGAVAGRDLAQTIASADTGPTGPSMSEVAAAIDEDRATLEAVMQRLGVEKTVVKQAAGRLVEKLGRLRMHQTVTGHPGLSRVLELEALIMGVNGKLALWRALREITTDDDRLAGVDLDDLIGRAQAQLGALEELHRAAAADAF